MARFVEKWSPVLAGLLLCALSLSAHTLSAQTDLVGDVRADLAQNAFVAAGAELKTYKEQHGVTSEYIEALSWMARGASANRQWDDADKFATETRQLSQQQLTTSKRKLDSDPHLAMAVGAAYEVL